MENNIEKITIILTGYKRNYFKEQIESIKKQKNIEIEKIILWQNENHIDLNYLKDYGVDIIKSDINLKYHGRFTLPLLFNTKWTAIFDDDIIPGEGWLENAIRCSKEHNCISGANGRWYLGNGKQKGISDNGGCVKDTKVDFVGHIWVFKTEWIKYMWIDKTYSYDSGEDIQFCLASKIHGGIDSYVPKQDNIYNTSSMRNYASDKHASFKTVKNHSSIRTEILDHWTNKLK